MVDARATASPKTEPRDLGRLDELDLDRLDGVLWGRFGAVGEPRREGGGIVVAVEDLDKHLGEGPTHRLELHLLLTPKSPEAQARLRRAYSVSSRVQSRVLAIGECGEHTALFCEPPGEGGAIAGKTLERGEALSLGGALASLLARLHKREVFGVRFRPEALSSDHGHYRVSGFGHLTGVPGASQSDARVDDWAETANSILSEMNWPGGAVLDSADFQLADRWRELLNELARLALVVPEITMAEAFSQLGAMASEAVFQPESTESRLQVIGPLEAAGARFDRLWICGLTASQWPPAARPSALISRRLQRRYQMPDADPKDTTEYAQRMLERLLGAAVTCRCSYARMAGDSEQSPTSLLADVSILPAESGPGWHAQDLVALGCATTIADDPVPPVSEDERVRGGAATLQHQLSEPFGAFAYGRLGIRRLESIAAGLGPLVRGNLVHAALFRLYERLPTALELRAWGSAETEQQVAMAIEATFPRYERRADKVLQSLLALERRRVAQLLTSVIDLDRNREEFRVKAVEGIHEFRHGNLSLELRIDRIDRLEDGSVAVLDYKTGTPRRFLNADGDPRDIQLVVYAYSLEDPVSMMGLYNIDSRQTAIEASNAEDTDDWSATLARWFSLVERAAEELAGGDVRLHSRSSVSEARPLSLLTRFGELTRDA